MEKWGRSSLNNKQRIINTDAAWPPFGQNLINWDIRVNMVEFLLLKTNICFCLSVLYNHNEVFLRPISSVFNHKQKVVRVILGHRGRGSGALSSSKLSQRSEFFLAFLFYFYELRRFSCLLFLYIVRSMTSFIVSCWEWLRIMALRPENMESHWVLLLIF